MDDARNGVSIRIAGNTWIPCLMALRAKGYHVRLDYLRVGSSDTKSLDYQPDYQAECEGASFSATSPAELLGLVAMWETRGDDWKIRPGELELEKEIRDTARTFDSDGNELQDD